MKKILGVVLTTIVLLAVIWYSFIYFATYSDGYRSGELIKFSHKGVIVKTWEGEVSQGISGTQIFSFTVMDNQPEVIKRLKEYQVRRKIWNLLFLG